MERIRKWWIKSKEGLNLPVLVIGGVIYGLSQRLINSLNIRIPRNSLGFLFKTYSVSFSVISVFILIGLFFIVYQALWAIVFSRRKLKILSAKYGASETFVDITSELNKMVKGNKLVVLISNSISGDPLPNIGKRAIVTYENSGKKKTVEVNEGQILSIPD